MYRGELQGIKSRHKELFGVFTDWHYPKADFRIILLVKDPIDKDKMLVVYHNEEDIYRMITRESTMEASAFKESDL